ncbi:MAG TPA: MFS transporter [Lacipirellula sp.]
MADAPDDPRVLSAVPPPEQTAVPATVLDEPTPEGVAIRSLTGARLCVAQFLHLFALGSWIVTLGSYVEANTGASGSGIFAAGFIGTIYGAGPLGGMVAPFLTGLLADHFFATEKLMALLHLLGAAALGGAIAAESQSAFYVAALCYFLTFIPNSALLSSMTFHHLARPDRDYPIARACSTGGWMASGLFVGWLWPTVTGMDSVEATNIPLKIAMTAELVMAAFCLTLPHTPPANKRQAGGPRRFSLAHTTSLLSDPRFMMLMALAVLAHVPSQFYYAYLNAYLNDWVQWDHAAAKMTLGQMVEIGVMLILPAVLLRVSIKTSMLIGLAFWVLRFWLISLSPSLAPTSRDAALYVAIGLHGVAFTLLTISLQMDVDRCAGRGRRATAQGLLAVAMSGIGCFIGSELAGVFGTRLLPEDLAAASVQGWRQFWLIPAGIAAGVWLLTAVFLPRDRALRARSD